MGTPYTLRTVYTFYTVYTPELREGSRTLATYRTARHESRPIFKVSCSNCTTYEHVARERGGGAVSDQREILVGERDDGTDLYLPVVELLTGRGFVTGKSGSGKSNTASVIAEELLESGFPLLIVDTDGEYYGLKEEYEMLHAGADEECDIQIGPEHAEQMASLALEENVPVILDVSGYLDEEVADELLRKIARQLFVKEKKLKKPFLLVVEEVHEYIPEGGGMGETGRLLIKISKRGRKHGLGILGISQRPADVKKDFITQANWLVWHRLTWDNDTNVVGRIIDTEYSELVSELNDGQGFVQTDWMDVDVRKVQFRRKRTFDAGATPGLDDFERPELKSVSDALVGDLQDISERKDREESRILELENELEKKEKRIETLEDELESARDVSNAAKQMADALTRKETLQTKLGGGDDEELRRLHDEIVDLETERDDLEDERDELQAKLDERTNRIETLEGKLSSRTETVDRLREENERLRDRVRDLETAVETEEVEESNAESTDETEILQAGGDDVEFGFTSVEWPSQTESDADESEEITTAPEPKPPEAVFEGEWIDDRLERAAEQSQCTASTARRALVVLARDGPLESAAIADAVGRSTVAVQGLCSELLTEGVVERPVARTYTLSDDVRSKLDAMASAE
ncbi:AAA-like domain-containing protein [Natronorubrum texcoconense]|uniref:AAA-like domain-containing protein n=1 Tax=Natronorubrum texcoconense TaxID=1095776 RepID=A0A1G9FNX3_9EURY|nr:AAA-like domain-containing protein [Natronorubrum texcoconense]